MTERMTGGNVARDSRHVKGFTFSIYEYGY